MLDLFKESSHSKEERIEAARYFCASLGNAMKEALSVKHLNGHSMQDVRITFSPSGSVRVEKYGLIGSVCTANNADELEAKLVNSILEEKEPEAYILDFIEWLKPFPSTGFIITKNQLAKIQIVGVEQLGTDSSNTRFRYKFLNRFGHPYGDDLFIRADEIEKPDGPVFFRKDHESAMTVFISLNK